MPGREREEGSNMHGMAESAGGEGELAAGKNG